jgi:hypothetical protein
MKQDRPWRVFSASPGQPALQYRAHGDIALPKPAAIRSALQERATPATGLQPIAGAGRPLACMAHSYQAST